MGKPLLTDEMIERARRGEDITGPNMVDAEETKIIRTDHRGFGYERPVRESRSQNPQERYSKDLSLFVIYHLRARDLLATPRSFNHFIG